MQLPNPFLVLGGLLLIVTLGVAIGLDPLWGGIGFSALVICAAVATLLLRYPERGLWLLAIVLPYERLGTVPTGLLTLKMGHVVTASVLFVLAARTVIIRQIRLAFDPLRLPLLLFVVASILSLINAQDLVRGIALVGQLLIGILVYFVTINLLSRANLKPTLVALCVGGVLVSIFGLYQFVGDYAGLPADVTGLVESYSGAAAFGFARITGPSLEPLYFANYLLIPLLTAIALLFAAKRKKIVLAVVLLLLVVFVLTLARGAYLGLLAGLAVIALRYWRQIFTTRVIVGTVGVLAIVASTVIWLLLQTGTDRETPLESFGNQISVTGSDTSSQQRIGTVSAAAQLVRDHPLIGVGVGNFGHYYQDPLAGTSDRQVSQTVHNQPFETLVETGLLGLAALLFVGYVLAERTIRAWKRVRGLFMTAALAGSAAAVLAIFVQAQTFSALYLMHVWFAMGLLVGVQNLILTPRKAAQ